MDHNINGKIMVVTGAAEGLGYAMVKSFLHKGLKLAVILDINEEKGKEAVATLTSEYGSGRVAFYKCDVVTDLETSYTKILDNYKKIDILINNAGILDESNIKRTMDINATAVMEWTIKFFDHMRIDKGGKGGSIINVSSIYGYRIIPYIPYYHGSKFAVIGFSKSLGHQRNFKKMGVRVVTLCPGLTYTNIADNINMREEDMLEEHNKTLVDYKWQTPDDIGQGTVEIFEKADSGTVWLVEGARPAEKLDILKIQTFD